MLVILVLKLILFHLVFVLCYVSFSIFLSILSIFNKKNILYFEWTLILYLHFSVLIFNNFILILPFLLLDFLCAFVIFIIIIIIIFFLNWAK